MEQKEWQKGNESSMTSLQRLELHILWLQQLHAEMRQAILERKIKEFGDDKEDYPLQGFPRE